MTLLRWLTFVLGSQTVIFIVLLFWIYLFLLTLVLFYNGFPSFLNDFPTNSQQDAPFHCIDYDYSRADWDGLRDHLRDVPWEDIFKLGASAAASEFSELVRVGIDVYIPHTKYLHGFQLLVLLS